MNKIKRQHNMSLMELSTWDGCTRHLRFIISKSVVDFKNRNTKISQVIAMVNNLLETCLTGKEPNPYVAVSVVACFLQYQLMGVLL